MRNNQMEHPFPVIKPGGKDYLGSSFDVDLVRQGDEGKNLEFVFSCNIGCESLRSMRDRGEISFVIKVLCPRTSYRSVINASGGEETLVAVPKEMITDSLILQGLLVASKNGIDYNLPEFNPLYFGNASFVLNKGNIVAYAPEIIVKLDAVLEKNIPSIVLITTAHDIKELKVVYAKDDEENERYKDYITVWLPEDEYRSYEQLRKKRTFKSGISRYLQASLVVPALTEGLSRIRMEDREEPEEGEGRYRGTIWADSICEALKNNYGIDDLNECQYSDYELANKLLGNVEGDAIDNLQRKLKDWSTIRQEDDIL